MIKVIVFIMLPLALFIGLALWSRRSKSNAW
jgi:hypothetical protein